MDDLDLLRTNARDLEMNDVSSFNGPNLKPSLQQKRNTQERLRLHIPKHTIQPEATSSVHFKVNDKPEEPDAKCEHLPSQKQESTSSLPSPKERSIWKALAPGSLQWIPKNLNRTNLQPVIRCAISAWISLLLVLIPHTERFLGQSSFIIMIASFLSPPAGPFIAVVEKEIVIQLTVSGAYAWSCLGIMLANLTRKEVSSNAIESDILKGRYIEAMPSIICAIFLCVGTSLLLYWRAKMGQGKPVTAAMILSCTTMDSALTVAPLYPYPNYQTGIALVVPIAFHSVIAMICALCIFPESIHAQFRHRFRAVFSPLVIALRAQSGLLRTPCHFDAEFDAGVNEFTALVQSAEVALGPLAATGRLMKKDISYGRFHAGDFKAMHELTRLMTVRANGMAFYFKIMDPSRHKFPGTPAISPVHSRPPSRPVSRPTSPPSTPNDQVEVASPKSANGSTVSRRRRTHASKGTYGYFHLNHHNHANHSNKSLFKEIRTRGPEHAVGVFESQAYLNLETRFAHADADALRARTMGLLGASAEPLLMRCADTLEHVGNWLQRVNDDRLWVRLVMRKRVRQWREIVRENEDIKAELINCLEEFRKSRRHRVLDLYRSSVDPRLGGTPGGDDPPPHRYLFQCYLYQYHLIHFTKDLIDFVGEITKLESTRLQSKVWLPIHPLRKLLVWNRWEPSDNDINPEDDEDPDLVSGIRPEAQGHLGFAAKRDPDALPPHTILGAYGRAIYRAFNALGHGNAVFAFKAGLMAALLSLPSFLPGSVEIAISNRSVWAIVLGQTTLSRFRGDTVAGLISRILSTFFGGVVGLIMWYISAGNGMGNAYALGALAVICFPFFFFARIYYPGPPINVVFFFLTSQLVLGFSWENTHLPSISVTGYGLTVAWKRFLMVTIGVTVAFIFSFLPPSTTLRRYLRTTYATTSGQLGQLYCDILSLATVSDRVKTEEIVKNLVAVRMKLNRTRALRKNVIYEFSLQGRWPAERYKRVLDIQMEIAYLLSHLRSVEDHLEPEWGRAFLRRTRFMDSEFQGDILSVICMISIALRTGVPLPQVTPCPLLDRFVSNNSGIDDYGLPRAITIDTLENEQYLYFSVGVATAFGIITRLDRLMLATKELVGEQYHIQGVLDMSRRMTSEKMYL